MSFPQGFMEGAILALIVATVLSFGYTNNRISALEKRVIPLLVEQPKKATSTTGIDWPKFETRSTDASAYVDKWISHATFEWKNKKKTQITITWPDGDRVTISKPSDNALYPCIHSTKDQP